MPNAPDRLAVALSDRYVIERELGQGGMATVYLAHDVRHDRKVALKVLRPELSAILGAERFLKEIRTTANLQHPHILGLYDSGEADGMVFYVMPFVEGESLRDRITRERQLPVDDAVRIAREVADALDYAHRHGVIHRDIKPENILLHDGRALVADFGIALAVSSAGGDTRLTETGMSLGTPHYMSPEQAMGEREVTPRSDVYALGCILYEMLVGEPPFTGPTAQSIIARVMTEEPRRLTIQRRSVPPQVEDAVLHALEKLPADRFATAREFGEALGGGGTAERRYSRAHATPPAPAAAPPYRRSGLIAVAALILVAGAVGGWLARGGAPPLPPMQLSASISPDHRLTGAPVVALALSPNGRTVVYVGESARGVQLYARRLDDLTPTPIPGTEGATDPVFSPDGSWIAFRVGTQYRKVPSTGGSPVGIPMPAGVGTILWTDPEKFLVTSGRGDLGRVGSDGAFTLIAPVDSDAGEFALYPTGVLPDGHVLVVGLTTGLTGPLHAIHPETGARTTLTRSLVAGAGYANGYVMWALSTGALLAAPYRSAGDLTGGSTALAANVRVVPGSPAQFAVSPTGVLAYVPSQPFDLVITDRAGRMEIVSDRSQRFHSPRVSPDGSQIAMDIAGHARDVWVMHLSDGTLTRVTFDNDGHDPHWMPDGRSVLYSTSRGGRIGVFRRRVDGAGVAESVLVAGLQMSAHAVTPDGRRAVVAEFTEGGHFDLVMISLTGDARPEPLLATPFNESWPALSPDGRWLAYVSDESGRFEVYVRPLDETGGRILVSQNGGNEPVWARNGRELYYRDFDGPSIMAAVIETSPALRVVSRTRLFDVAEYEAAAPHANYDVTPDGRFVFVRQGRLSEIVYVQNWPGLVQRQGGR